MSNMLRTLVTGYVENIRGQLENIIDELYKNPEESFREEKSSKLLIDILSSENFKVQGDVEGIKHSFIGSFGDEGPTIAFICEYNSSGLMGHGFGHNVQSAISIGAAIGLKRAIELNEAKGRVLVYGCPSEEGYFTKIQMFNKGLFEGVDAVMSTHPYEKTCESGSSLAMKIISFKFTGKEAHTSINYLEGINALEPCRMLLDLSDKIKLKLAPSIYINGIIKNGGEKTNLIPGFSECEFMVKGREIEKIQNVCNELLECALLSAKLFNCSLEHSFPEPEYLPLKTHRELSRVLCHNLKEKGIIDIGEPVTIPASLDLGNISYEIPTVQPYIGICENNPSYYTMEFSRCTITPHAKDRMLKAASALALTGVDVIQNPDILKKQND